MLCGSSGTDNNILYTIQSKCTGNKNYGPILRDQMHCGPPSPYNSVLSNAIAMCTVHAECSFLLRIVYSVVMRDSAKKENDSIRFDSLQVNKPTQSRKHHARIITLMKTTK